MLLPSSTVITPSLPTFSIASAIICPISSSPLADTVATADISSLLFTGVDNFLISSIVAVTALSIPLLSFIGSCPAAVNLIPSLKIAWASTVAVVVPSPATSLVLDATSFTICAPIFSNLFSRSISFATVTPSFVTTGAPKVFSIKTFLPLGPNVAFTAFASLSTPSLISDWASVPNKISFAIL